MAYMLLDISGGFLYPYILDVRLLRTSMHALFFLAS
jgi:hypothetical protein